MAHELGVQSKQTVAHRTLTRVNCHGEYNYKIFIEGAMIRLTYLAVLFLSCSADPKSPRIYNVLISSKKNLSPSHAQPVYEPVLRTTSIGYAFPSLFYHTSFVQNVPITYINPDYSGLTRIETSIESQRAEAVPNTQPQFSRYAPQLPLNNDQNINVVPQQQIPQEISKNFQRNEPAALTHFIPQYDPYALNYANYLPSDHAEESAESSRVPAFPQQDETDPKRVIANLKKNPQIPDVPPPPLPVKISA